MSRPADPVEAYDRAIARIARFNPGLNAVLEMREARAEAEASARRVKAGEPRSPVDGLPVAVKANIALSGLAWHAGIAAYRDRIAQRDAACVARLKAAGAVVFGELAGGSATTTIATTARRAMWAWAGVPGRS